MDEVFKQTWHEHDGNLTSVLAQPDESLILERNKEIRKNPGLLRQFGKGTQTWADPIATIPLIMIEKAKREGMDMMNPDADIAQRAINQFLKTDSGRMCLLKDTQYKTQKYF